MAKIDKKWQKMGEKLTKMTKNEEKEMIFVKKLLFLLFFIAILSSSLNIYQAHRERNLYDQYNEACIDLMREHYCISALEYVNEIQNISYIITPQGES